MKASKFLDAQKALILKQGADGITVAEICCKAGIRFVAKPASARRPISICKKKYDGLLLSAPIP